MTRIISLFLVLALWGCSESSEPTVTVTADGQDSASVESAGIDESPSPTGYTDYIWCSKGENYSLEALDVRNAQWLQGIDGLGISELGVVEITPSNWSSDKFDWITALFWPDKAARDQGWAAYQASGLEKQLEAAHPGVEVCGGENWENVFPTIAYQIRAPKPSEVFKVGYQFCSFRADMEPEDLRTVIRGSWSDFLAQYDAENPDSTYGTIVSVPDFDSSSGERHEGVPTTWDVLWVNVWGDPLEIELGQAAVDSYGQEMMTAFDKVMECTDDQIYDGRVVLSGNG